MKLTKKILCLVLSVLVIIGTGAFGAAYAENGSSSVGTVTLKTKIYKLENGAYSEVKAPSILNCGDVIKVVVSAKTDFITGSSSIQVFYNINYYTPYMNGTAYTKADITALESGYITVCTKENGYNSKISDSNLYLNSIKLEYCGGRVNCGSKQVALFWPYEWRDGNTVKSEYSMYDYVWINLTATSGAPNDKNDGKGARLMKISEQDIFAFELQVKRGKVTCANDTADIFIPEASVKNTLKRANNKTMFSKYTNAYTASPENPVQTGFYYDLDGAQRNNYIVNLSQNITVDDITMNYGKTVKATAQLSGNLSGKKVVWSSTDESVVTVDKDGNVTSHARGTAKLIANIEGGTSSAVCEVTVKFSFVQLILYYVFFGWIWMK